MKNIIGAMFFVAGSVGLVIGAAIFCTLSMALLAEGIVSIAKNYGPIGLIASLILPGAALVSVGCWLGKD